jgi:Protein of unknown function (DUF2865)
MFAPECRFKQRAWCGPKRDVAIQRPVRYVAYEGSMREAATANFQGKAHEARFAARGQRPDQSGDMMRFILGLAAAILVSLATAGAAQAQSAECQRLQQAIASAGRGGGQGAQYEAAAQRQRGEIERTSAYARSIGCENRKFLFFGSNPPAQCDQINGQLSRMQANLADLQSRSGGAGGGRAELVARYNSECAAPQHSGGIFDALFGGQRDQNPDVETVPVSPDAPNPDQQQQPGDGSTTEAHAGSKAVCVRSCDGSFFPVSYAAYGRLEDLQDMCRALCPNAEVTLYTYSPSADIDQAVSITGAHYMDSPTALKYRKSVDNSCSCRRRGQSWAEALVGAEQRLGSGGKTDIMVTPERSAELSRPKLDPKAKPGKTPPLETPKISTPDPKAAAQDQTPIDQLLGQQAATVSREPSGIAVGDAATGAVYTKGQGQTQEITGPDGVKRRVRIIDPTL